MIKLEWVASQNLSFHGKTAISLRVFNYVCLSKKEKGIQREREEINTVGDSTCYFTQWESIPEKAHDGGSSHHPIKKCMFFVQCITVHACVPKGTETEEMCYKFYLKAIYRTNWLILLNF